MRLRTVTAHIKWAAKIQKFVIERPKRQEKSMLRRALTFFLKKIARNPCRYQKKQYLCTRY